MYNVYVYTHAFINIYTHISYMCVCMYICMCEANSIIIITDKIAIESNLYF